MKAFHFLFHRRFVLSFGFRVYIDDRGVEIKITVWTTKECPMKRKTLRERRGIKECVAVFSGNIETKQKKNEENSET